MHTTTILNEMSAHTCGDLTPSTRAVVATRAPEQTCACALIAAMLAVAAEAFAAAGVAAQIETLAAVGVGVAAAASAL